MSDMACFNHFPQNASFRGPTLFALPFETLRQCILLSLLPTLFYLIPWEVEVNE